MDIRDLYRLYEAETGTGLHGRAVQIEGWVRSNRASREFGFLEINDGTDFRSVQVVYEKAFLDNFQDISKLPIAAAITVQGILELTPQARQPFEIKAKTIRIDAGSASDYPLQKKRHSMEFLREIAHLRPRSNTFSAVFRVRSLTSMAIHTFFQERGFVYVHTPVLTGNDAEGAGEMFRVVTVDPADSVDSKDRRADPADSDTPKGGRAEPASANRIPGSRAAERPDPGQSARTEATTQEPAGSESHRESRISKKEFFGKPAWLTVSGQLEAEIFALAFKNVYTFGPTFRAEDSNTTRHASEFWMVEPEMAFADLEDDMEVAEAMIKSIIRYVLAHAPQEMDFFDRFVAKGVRQRMQDLVEADFARITYTEAVTLLQKSGRDFVYPVEWGIDLQTEHERYLTDEVFRGPVFVTDYPKDIKAFYMRLNDDGKTVAAMDLLVPGIGEIIGGSQREERPDVLEKRIRDLGMDPAAYDWYLDLRKYGGVRHAGFGLGLERMIMYLTGMQNIRDVIPFPRTPRSLEF